jgi:hypothetical protein
MLPRSQCLCLFLGAWLLLCAGVLAQTNPTAPPAAPGNKVVDGSVWSADLGSLVVRSRAVEPVAFTVPYDARITLNGQRVALEKLRRWDSVRVTAHPRGEALVATRIEAWTPL